MRLTDLTELEFQSDGKEKDQDAKVGDVIQNRTSLCRHAKAWANGINEKSGCKKPDKRRKTEWSNGEPKEERSTNGKDFKHHIFPYPSVCVSCFEPVDSTHPNPAE